MNACEAMIRYGNEQAGASGRYGKDSTAGPLSGLIMPLRLK